MKTLRILALVLALPVAAGAAAFQQNFATTNPPAAASSAIQGLFVAGPGIQFNVDGQGRTVITFIGTNTPATNPPPTADSRYWGSAAKTVTNMLNTDVWALSSSPGTTRFMTQTITPAFGDYFYFAFPPYMGTPTFWMVGLGQMTGWLTNSISLTNGIGSATNYTVYQFPVQQGGSPITIQVQ